MSRPSPRRAALGLAAYRLATYALGPMIPFILRRRARRGKEDTARLGERFGIASAARPSGSLAWIHAASVGEALSVLSLIDRLRHARPDLDILVTTGTVTSARLMEERLPDGAHHQFAVLDHPDFTARFLDHWKPDLAVFVESEFWPNMIAAIRERGIPLALVNARIAERSFRGWQRFPSLIADLLGHFSLVLAQDRASADRLRALGARTAVAAGNLKHDAAALAAGAEPLATLRDAIGARPLWLAANTHESEEGVAADVHERLARRWPDLLTLIVPRHPARGGAIAAELRRRGFRVARRARDEPIVPATQIYLADTLGELGLFYRLADIVFVGGTFADAGGHNPFEPARLRCALVAGPVDRNFAEVYAAFEAAGALLRVADGAALADAVATLLDDRRERERRAAAAADVAGRSGDVAARTAEALLAFLPGEPLRLGGGVHAHA